MGPRAPREKLPPPRIAVEPSRILADGNDSATLSIESAEAPTISVSDTTHGVRIDDATGSSGRWQAHIRAGVMPGRIQVTVEIHDHLPASAEVDLILAANDSAEDGTPDFLRLDDEHDRQAFRRWFTYLAEAQYFQAPGARPAEINDCAALIRYAYREALHVARWGLGRIREAADCPGVRFRRQVSISIHASGSRAVPRNARTIPARRSGGGSVSPVRRRADAVALQFSFRQPRSLARVAWRFLFFRQQSGHDPSTA